MAIKITSSDKLFSQYIRTRDKWTCQRCSKKYEPPTNALHCSHFHTRGKWGVRFDDENCEALCYGCHSYLGGNPIEHVEHKINKLGYAKYKKLQQRSHKPLKSGEKKYFLSKEFRAKLRKKLKKVEEKWLNDK